MELRQSLKQSLKLNMTAELKQAIHLLQFSAIDLVDFINKKAEENPLIEFQEQSLPFYSNQNKLSSFSENLSVTNIDFKDQLLLEVSWMRLGDNARTILIYLINSLDEHGFLDLNEKEACRILNCTMLDLETGIKRLQSFDPKGIGARNIEECLTLQILAMENINHSFLLKLVGNLELIAAQEWSKLERICTVSHEEVQTGVKLLRTLNPKPIHFCQKQHEIQYILPDIIIKKNENAFAIIIDGGITKFRYNKEYFALTKNDAMAHHYVNNKYKEYRWLKRSLEQRYRTLQSFAHVILQKQRKMMELGKTYLKPMTMKEIAMEMNVHESTVSRVVKNKYIQTPEGMFPIRELFTSSISTNTGEEISSSYVRQKIQQLILQEDKMNPLSDQSLANQLKTSFGIQISRRTITKYRKEMELPSSSLRK